MARRSAALKPQLNRIRAWAHEGSTDAWIAHQLETTAEAVRAFRQEHGIERGGPAPLAPITPDSVVEAMLAEEAAALEAGPEPNEPIELEAAVESADAASEDEPARAPRRRTRRPVADEVDGPEVATAPDEPAEAETEADAPAKPSRRRGARGGAGRSTRTAAQEAPADAEAETADDEPEAETGSADARSDEEPGRSPRKRGRRRGRGRGGSRGLEARLLPGSVLLLDPSVVNDATFQEHWADAGALRVEVSTDAIVLRRIAADPEPDRS
jgi:hypothetical protein